jgi:hypothetical protein
MPPPAKIAIWPFIKELLFNKTPIMEYIKRNRLITGLFIAVIILVFTNLFITEQAIRLSNMTHNKTNITVLENQITHLKSLVNENELSAANLVECRYQLDLVNKKLLTTSKECPPTPNPNSRRREKESFIPPRSFTDDSLRRKLDAIRVD